MFQIDPVNDPRWGEFVLRHPCGTIFHTAEWLAALQRTYGYDPIAFTTNPPASELTNGVVFCRVQSWLTGHRVVSVPFSDHCDPLVESEAQLDQLLSGLKRETDAGQWNYVELRPRLHPPGAASGMGKTTKFWLHRIDLRPALKELFLALHKDCIQRKIRRAQREHLTCEEGRSERLLRQFYSLLVMTRRGQRLPPQPLDWFRNLIECVGQALKIRVASKAGAPVAGILTLQHQNTLVYKYSCSDKRFNAMGGTPLLLWRAMKQARDDGMLEFDLGRSDLDNPGLATFKERLGASRSLVTYWSYPKTESTAASAMRGVWRRLWNQTCGHMPASLLCATGRALYRHAG